MQDCVRPTGRFIHGLTRHMPSAQACIDNVHSLLPILDRDSYKVFDKYVTLLFSNVELLGLRVE